MSTQTIPQKAMAALRRGNANGRFVIKTFNKISAAGLARFDESKYSIAPADSKPEVAHAILLRSHKLQEADVPLMCRAIARCGAGTNNCNVKKMTELGKDI